MTEERAENASEYSTLEKLGITSSADRKVAMCKQQTRPWFELRVGCLTGSKAARLMKLDGTRKAASTVDALLNELVVEKIIGEPVAQGDGSWAMERGNFCEKLAKMQYWLDFGAPVLDVGYVAVEPMRWGCSPDGFLAPHKGIEIKCRTAKEHLYYLRKRRLKPEDMMQCQFDMWCCGLSQWEFYAFWPTDTEHALIDVEGGSKRALKLPSWMITVKADETLFAGFDKYVPAFCDDVQRAADEIAKGTE